MSGKNISFEDRKINKSAFYKNKKIFNIHDLDNILVSKKEPYGTKNSLKYLIGYNDDDDDGDDDDDDDDDVIRPLCIKLPQTIGYVKDFDTIKKISFKVSDNKLLKKNNKIWEKISNLMNIEFDSEPVHGDNNKYIKAKIKVYQDRVNTSFQGEKVPKENASYKCLSLIMLDSVIRANKKYYTQTLLGECRYAVRKNKM